MLLTGHGIRVIACVHTAEGIRDVDLLKEEEKRRLGSKLLTLWLNEIYRGRAMFTEPEPAAAEEAQHRGLPRKHGVG
jgi:hypothetical protein